MTAPYPKVRLEECCEIVSGATPSTSVDSYWNGDICWATPKDLSELEGAYISDTPRKLTQSGLDSCAATVLPVGSVLFSSRAPIGLVAVNTVRMATNQGFKSFVPKVGSIEAKFLYWWLRTHRTQLENLGNGATFKELSKAAVARIEIPLPSIPEQRRIAEILDKTDALRAKRRATLAKLDSLSQSVFLDMFGDPSSNPKNWQPATLGDVVLSVSDGPHVSPEYADAGIPFLSTRNIRAGEIIWNDLKYIRASDAAIQWKKCKPELGDILYTKGGTTGLAAAVTTDTEFAVWVHVALLKPDTTKVDSEWLESMLNTKFCYWQSQELTHGIANRDLGLTRMVRIRMFLPPLDMQREFTKRKLLIKRQKELFNGSRDELDALFSSLRNCVFLGDPQPCAANS